MIFVPEPTYEHQYAVAEGSRYRLPDAVVLRQRHRGRPANSQNVRLVAEIVSPGGGEEYDQKMTVYAQAGSSGI
ncbi:Uma2 family endonuclease [Fodinicola acaciae]|uniref:Uma2 family endonuclease n=1 Tax=Fodinicola acaciae TaxID=2681555 RepID=UPI0013D1C888